MEMFRRKSLRIAVKESLQDVSNMEVTVVPEGIAKKPEKKAKNPKKIKVTAKDKPSNELQTNLHVSRMRKRANTIETTGKRKYVRKKPFVSKKAKIQARLEVLQNQDTIDNANAENLLEVALIEDKLAVDKKTKRQNYRVEPLNPVIDYSVSWDEDFQLKQEMGKLNIKTLTNYDSIDFGSNGNGDIKISSWSIDGINRLIQKGGMEFFHREQSDIFCLQNLKCSSEKEVKSKLTLDGYEGFFSLGIGYSGSGVLTKIKPLSVKFETEIEELDEVGSVMVLEFEKFQLVSVNAPTAGFGLKKLKKKLMWHDALNDFIDELSMLEKPLVITGNFQAALTEIGE
jgi:hypothetical protein